MVGKRCSSFRSLSCDSEVNNALNGGCLSFFNWQTLSKGWRLKGNLRSVLSKICMFHYYFFLLYFSAHSSIIFLRKSETSLMCYHPPYIYHEWDHWSHHYVKRNCRIWRFFETVPIMNAGWKIWPVLGMNGWILWNLRQDPSILCRKTRGKPWQHSGFDNLVCLFWNSCQYIYEMLYRYFFFASTVVGMRH